MKRLWVGISLIVITALAAVSIFPTQQFLLWNRTDSAPKGLYWRSNSPLTPHGWAVVSANAPAAKWISERGYLAPDWPIIKRIQGITGDVICRDGAKISVNKKHIADALATDSMGENLPNWQGCFTLNEDEIFLLNDHPRSLDGRYFGPTSVHDLDGSAHLLWQSN